jgi:hypothetical protein
VSPRRAIEFSPNYDPAPVNILGAMTKPEVTNKHFETEVGIDAPKMEMQT